jgi:hypothetical protein
MLLFSLIKIKKRIKRFKHENPRITHDMAQVFSLCCIGIISVNAIVKSIFRNFHPTFFSLVPIGIITIQITFYIIYKRQSDREIRESEDVINSEDYYIEECKSGWISPGQISYKDYIKSKMYKAYPLKDWTPLWEKIVPYGN